VSKPDWKKLSRLGNRCVLIGYLWKVMPMMHLERVGKRVTDAKIMIRGGSWEDGKWVKAPGLGIVITAWNDQADVLAGMEKGALVRVEGYLRTQGYFNDLGQWKTGLSLRAQTVRRLDTATTEPLEAQGFAESVEYDEWGNVVYTEDPQPVLDEGDDI